MSIAEAMADSITTVSPGIRAVSTRLERDPAGGHRWCTARVPTVSTVGGYERVISYPPHYTPYVEGSTAGAIHAAACKTYLRSLRGMMERDGLWPRGDD